MQFLLHIFSLLSKYKIKYSVLRNYEKLPNSLNNSDLDILVAEQDLKKFYIFLNDALKKFQGTIISVQKGLSPKYCLLGNYPEPWGIQIDVFYGGIPYSYKYFIDEDTILQNSQLINRLYCLNKTTSAYVVLLKEILNNKRISNAKYTEIEPYINNEKFSVLVAQLFDKNTAQTINKKLELGLYRDLRQTIIKKLNINLFIKYIFNLKKINRIFNRPGISIAFLGVDGAGKTTIIESLKPVLSSTFHKAYNYEHLRPNLLPSIARLFGRKEEFNGGPVTNPHKSKPAGILGSFFRFNYYFIDYFWGYYIKIYIQLIKKSSVWVFDRYYYDYFFDPKRSRINLPHWLLKFYLFIMPEPDLIFCLGGEPGVIHTRKKELPIEEIARQNKLLKKFAIENKKAFWIETTEDIEKSVASIIEIIRLNITITEL